MQSPVDLEAAAGLLRWWRDAGVDTLVEDAPRNWLARLNPLPTGDRVLEQSEAGRGAVLRDSASFAGRGAAVPLPVGERVKDLPSTLPALLAWMRDSADVPEARWGRIRLLPSGDPESDLMILTDMPEPGDAAAGTLMAGELGALFDKMLAAIDRDRASIWLAPLATVRPVGGRIAPEAAGRLVEIVRHHLSLVRPKRLLIMGDAPNRALIGPEWAAARGGLQTLNLGETTVEAVPTFHPRLLLERPAYKAQAWKDLQLLMKGL